MAIEKLAGTRQDLIILCQLIEKDFEKKQQLGQIPKYLHCEVKWKLWPAKTFQISIKDEDQPKPKIETAPFNPVIAEFGPMIDSVIDGMVQEFKDELMEE